MPRRFSSISPCWGGRPGWELLGDNARWPCHRSCRVGIVRTGLASSFPSCHPPFLGGDAPGRMEEAWGAVGGAGTWLCPLSVVQVGCGQRSGHCPGLHRPHPVGPRRTEEEDGVVFPEAGAGPRCCLGSVGSLEPAGEGGLGSGHSLVPVGIPARSGMGAGLVTFPWVTRAGLDVPAVPRRGDTAEQQQREGTGLSPA